MVAHTRSGIFAHFEADGPETGVVNSAVRKVLVPCAAADDERTLEICRSLGMQTRALFPTRIYDINRPAPMDGVLYVKRMNPEAVIDAARIFGADAVFAPKKQPVLETSCRDAGLAYLDPAVFKAH